MQESNYWAMLQTPNVHVSPSVNASTTNKYLNYRDLIGDKQPNWAVQNVLNELNSQKQQMTQKGTGMPPKPKQTGPNMWPQLLKRAQTALGMKTQPSVSEESIQIIFERLLNKVELMNVQKNHALENNGKNNQSNRPGQVIKSVPAQAQEEDENNNKKPKSVLKQKYAAAEPTVTLNTELTLEELQLKSQLDALPKSQLTSLVISTAKLLPATPMNPQEIPLLLKTLVKNPPQIIQLQNMVQFAHEKFSLLYNSVQNAPELTTYTSFCAKLAQDFIFITEKQASQLEVVLADYRELTRFRLRVADLAGHSLQLSQKGLVSVYDSIKQNGIVLEKLQLGIDQHAGQNRSSQVYLAAEELIGQASALQMNPNGNEGLGVIADTILWSQGNDRERYAKQCIQQAVLQAPKILIRLTDNEAFQGFQVVLFIVNYFSKLFQTPSVNQMIGKLAEIHMYVSTSKTLLVNIRRNLGLQQNASANKIIEAVQVLSNRAIEESGGAEIVERIKKILNVNEEDIISKIALLQQKENRSHCNVEEDEELDQYEVQDHVQEQYQDEDEVHGEENSEGDE
ncbi:Conserved_hypothetical protein [Hexamita inflata]|uniref:Uncharacterized protein n=1 Tax=Hexamita inflata TaxID=28002 RepID=A0AA86UX01_9EUKA|nr:Conserved hypothetical protein [Hexamita inflata]